MFNPPLLRISAVGGLVFATIALGQAKYDIIDLTERAAGIGVVQSEARGINERGEVVGFELLPEYKERAIYWNAKTEASFLPELPGDNTTVAVHVADDGTIYGESVFVRVEQVGHQTRIYWTDKATYWRNGIVHNLNDEISQGGELVDLKFAQDSDASGRIAGFAGLKQGPPFNSNGFLFDDGAVTDLGNLQRPVAMNNKRQIVGYGGGQDHAWLWDNGQLVDLHNHPNIGGVTTRAWGINDQEMIVGEAQFHISKPEEPALWLNRAPAPLVPEINRPQGIATAVNEKGVIVGFYADLDQIGSGFRGFIWKDGVRTDLATLLPPGHGWEQLFPFDVNEKGQIVGGGFKNGVSGRAFIMTPIGGTCTGKERLARVSCKDKKGRDVFSAKLKGGVAGDGFRVELSTGPVKKGVLGDKGEGKVKFRNVTAGPITASAIWDCGAEDYEEATCP